ncbi:Down syndrome cell adhesion molecule-like protein Dscam2 [Amphibalanus amphitrite]|uniref:Down syndrome cell adhesion molecule-like protein Dscam2 n=1 Tax=Amphibalanus amphitrite TaxID=1232801 RepID=A0A6A4VZ42_AMPAM|nr:Down syndrome cell adhesion molecule-like protein Dscam2 [Amphibalanus amphitrite]
MNPVPIHPSIGTQRILVDTPAVAVCAVTNTRLPRTDRTSFRVPPAEPERGADQGVGPSFTALPARDAGVFDRQTGVALECRADGSPTPALSWVTADGRPVTSVPGIRLVDRGQIRYFSFTSDMYNPDYHRTELRCMASNSAGAIISLPVRVWAVLSRPYELLVRDSFASAGGPALLTCDLPSYVTSHVTVASWVRDDEFNIYPSDDTGQSNWFACRMCESVRGGLGIFSGLPSYTM